MANGIRISDPRGFNKGRSSKFREGTRVRQTPGEGRKTSRPKRYGNNDKDEDNSPNTLNDKNHQLRLKNFDNKHLKKTGGHIGRNLMEITIKMKTIVRKPLMIKIIKLRLRNLDNKHLKKARGHLGRNVVEITIKMKTIFRKPLMIKIINLRLRNLDNKHLKKARGHLSRNVVEITIKMKTIFRKPLMIKIIKLRLRNLDN